MSKKGHVTVHHIEMYLCDKLPKRKLEALKDKFKKELKREQEDLKEYKQKFDDYVYEDEYNIYLERNEKNMEVLDALKKIFPDDEELEKLEI